MAYGDYWKVVSSEDYEKIKTWLDVHDFEDINTESVDIAYLLFGNKYGEDIGLVYWDEAEAEINEETGEPYYDEEDTWRYYSDYDEEDTIEYHISNDEKIQKLANHLAQNHWRYSDDLIPVDSDMTFEAYQDQLSEAGYSDF
ncbi:hypothetical protein RyT2_27640 [Pseudolactococcus yaeyamensis]